MADGIPRLPDAAEAAGRPGLRARHDLLPGLRHRHRLAARRGGDWYLDQSQRHPARAPGAPARRAAPSHRGIATPPHHARRGRILTRHDVSYRAAITLPARSPAACSSPLAFHIQWIIFTVTSGFLLKPRAGLEAGP